MNFPTEAILEKLWNIEKSAYSNDVILMTKIGHDILHTLTVSNLRNEEKGKTNR